MKINYEIQTQHGVITRKSDRAYTHAVYTVRTSRWNGGAMETCAPFIDQVSFCGSMQLAQKERNKRGENAFIVEAARKQPNMDAHKAPTNNTGKVVRAANEKFGEVMYISVKENAAHADFFFVACKREAAIVADRPYMIITAKLDKTDAAPGEISFFWGHYDLTLEQVNAEILKQPVTV